MPDTAHLVGGQAKILPRVFLGHIGDAQGLVEVLKLGLVGWQVPTFLVPCNVWCWAKRDQARNRGLPLNVAVTHLCGAQDTWVSLWLLGLRRMRVLRELIPPTQRGCSATGRTKDSAKGVSHTQEA